MTEYSTGFLFENVTSAIRSVILITKTKPEWQKGLLNGVGGKIEAGETPLEAMRREFHEEAGIDIQSWEPFIVLSGDEFRVHFFRAFADSAVLKSVRSVTAESVASYLTCQIEHLKTIPNLKWLIPMALSMDDDRANSFVVQEVMR